MAKKLTYEEVKNFIEVESESGCKLISEKYINTYSKLKIKCSCGEVFYVTFKNFKYRNVRKCGKCLNYIMWDITKIQKWLDENRTGFKCLSEKYDHKKKTKIKCSSGHEFETVWTTYYSYNLMCKECSGLNNKTTEIFKAEIYQFEKDNYVLLSEYVNAHTKVKLKHIKEHCMHEYFVTPNEFLKGTRCPKCSISKGENEVRKYLDNNKINYISQKTYDGLVGVGNGLLSYDFYLPKYNLLIEYQGEQHEKYIKGFHKFKKDFINQKEHDRRKNEYTKLHNINLLEIWYWDYKNIKTILEKELSFLM